MKEKKNIYTHTYICILKPKLYMVGEWTLILMKQEMSFPKTHFYIFINKCPRYHNVHKIRYTVFQRLYPPYWYSSPPPGTNLHWICLSIENPLLIGYPPPPPVEMQYAKFLQISTVMLLNLQYSTIANSKF